MSNPFDSHFSNELKERERLANEKKLKDEQDRLVQEKNSRRKLYKERYSQLVISVLGDLKTAKYFHPTNDNLYRVTSYDNGWTISKAYYRNGGGYNPRPYEDWDPFLVITIKFDDDANPVGFVCSMGNRIVESSLSQEALVKALVNLHTYTPRRQLQISFDELVEKAIRTSAPRFGHYPILKPDQNLSEYDDLPNPNTSYIGDWELGYRDDEGHWVTVMSVRLHLDKNDSPIFFDCTNEQGKISRGVASLEGLSTALRTLI